MAGLTGHLRQMMVLVLFCWGCSAGDPGAAPLGDILPATADGSADKMGGKDQAFPGCVPADIQKYRCPWSGGSNTCPASQVCRDFSTCVTPGCSDLPVCKVQPGKNGCFFTLAHDPVHPPDKELSYTTTVTSSGGAGSGEVLLGDAVTGLRVSWNLPAGMTAPVKVGDQVKVEACPMGPVINRRWVVVIRDLAGKLLLVGGQGINMSASPCLQRVVKTARKDLGCRPHKTPADPSTLAYTEAFALSFSGDAGPAAVAMGQQADFQVNGQAVSAFVCDARHPIEWPAYDIYGSLEGFVLVAR